MVKHLTDGVVMEKTVFLLNGQLKMAVSNSTVLAADEAQDGDGGDLIFAHKFKNIRVGIGMEGC